MDAHDARNLTLWHGYTPRRGLMINGHVVHHPRVVAW